MKLFCTTLTGADDKVDIDDMFSLSSRFPFIEWGILLYSQKTGTPRYPSNIWLDSLFERVKPFDRTLGPGQQPIRLAAHLCGDTVRDFIQDDSLFSEKAPTWIARHGLDISRYNQMFSRTQLNFNRRRNDISNQTLKNIFWKWTAQMDGALITQENDANKGVTETIQETELEQSCVLRLHHVLHDGSGGRGKSPDSTPRPIAGPLNGFAGGISPDNIVSRLQDIENIVGRGYIWIDMETGLRDGNDAFDMGATEVMLHDLSRVGRAHGWL